MNLPEILQWIKFGRKSGTAIFERQGVVKKIFFEDGLIISASSNDPKEYLGQVLICFGWIDEATLNEAFLRQRSSKRLLGRVLTEDFDIKPDNILKALRLKIEEAIYDLFLWDEGKFIYQAEASHLGEGDRLDTAITIDQVMFEGARRLDEWKEFKKEFPTDDVVFKIKDKAKSIGDLQKDFITHKIYQLIDGEKNIRRLLLDSHAPEYRGMESIAKLYWGGFIEPIKKAVAKPQQQLSHTPDRLKEAMDLYRDKKWEASYLKLEDYLRSFPDSEEANTLMRVVRDAYQKKLLELFPPDAIPELTMDISDLSEKIFNSREGFIASRINGQWDVKSIVMISPLGELESLQILKRLTDEGVIRFRH